jgi:hypothetical protein
VAWLNLPSLDKSLKRAVREIGAASYTHMLDLTLANQFAEGALGYNADSLGALLGTL